MMGPAPVDTRGISTMMNSCRTGDGHPNDGIAELRHVRSASEKRAAEEIANRQKCEDFESFTHLEQVQKELKAGLRETRAESSVSPRLRPAVSIF